MHPSKYICILIFILRNSYLPKRVSLYAVKILFPEYTRDFSANLRLRTNMQKQISDGAVVDKSM